MREREREKERALCYEKVLDGRVELCLCKETKQKTEKESFKPNRGDKEWRAWLSQ
jgi:hypothetical protein